MHIAVFGLWHLGTVTAACLADAGHDVVGLDPDTDAIKRLNEGKPPVMEPGLDALLKNGLESGKLRFTTSAAEAIQPSDVVWVTFDTPVNDDDTADVESVVTQAQNIFAYLKDGALVILSSQLPVGTTATLEAAYAEHENDAAVSFAVSPENLRLGKAIEVFMNPDRVVFGVRSDDDQARITELMAPITDRIEWMGVESAEMTKHAVNAFLALSVTFANEIAVLCERVGADAKEVERGLKSEKRIGPGAYLGPGPAFAGGTLARDVAFLGQLSVDHDLPSQVIHAVSQSNDTHKEWAVRRLRDLLGDDLTSKTVTLLGLTYKPGTDTLRRSLAIEMARRLNALGATVNAHDPAVQSVDVGGITLYSAVENALHNADATIVATPWPEYLNELSADMLVKTMRGNIVLDPYRFLANIVDDRLQYITVGQA